MLSVTKDLWLVCRTPRLRASFRLFCFPYAGAGASIYSSWQESLPDDIEVYSVQLPGRENRLKEAPYSRLLSLLQDLLPVILPSLNKPFSFFGHSMGALIAFELTRKLRSSYARLPFHLFVSACRAPQLRERHQLHQLADEEFVERLRRLQGTPEELLVNPDFLRFYLSVLRADITLNETYCYLDNVPLPCPITVFGGVQDEHTDETELEEWGTQTSSRFRVVKLPGNHFFVRSAQPCLLRLLTAEMEQTAPTRMRANERASSL